MKNEIIEADLVHINRQNKQQISTVNRSLSSAEFRVICSCSLGVGVFP